MKKLLRILLLILLSPALIPAGIIIFMARIGAAIQERGLYRFVEEGLRESD